MTYEEKLCTKNITREEAKAEILKHVDPAGWFEFLRDIGDKDEYTGGEVLGWLGH